MIKNPTGFNLKKTTKTRQDMSEQSVLPPLPPLTGNIEADISALETWQSQLFPEEPKQPENPFYGVPPEYLPEDVQQAILAGEYKNIRPMEQWTPEEKLQFYGVEKKPEELSRIEKLLYLFNVPPEQVNEISKQIWYEQFPGILKPVGTLTRFYRGIFRGLGGALYSLGQMIQSKTPDATEPNSLIKAGEFIQKIYEPITYEEWEGISSLLKPEYLVEKIPEQTGLMLPLMLPYIGGTIGATTALTRLGLSPKLAAFLGSIVGAKIGRSVEGMMEGGQAYMQAIEEGKDKATAAEIANKVYEDNQYLVASDAAQLFLPLATRRFGLSKLPSLVKGTGTLFFEGLSELSEETLQEIIQRKRAGKEIAWDKAMEEQAFMGGLFGIIFAGSEMIADRIANPDLRDILKKAKDEILATEIAGKAPVKTTEPTAPQIDFVSEPREADIPAVPTFSYTGEDVAGIKNQIESDIEAVTTQGFPATQGAYHLVEINGGYLLVPGVSSNFVALAKSIKGDPLGKIIAGQKINTASEINQDFAVSGPSIIEGSTIKNKKSAAEPVKKIVEKIVDFVNTAEKTEATPVYYIASNDKFLGVMLRGIKNQGKGNPTGIVFRFNFKEQPAYAVFEQSFVHHIVNNYGAENIKWAIIPYGKSALLTAWKGEKLVGISKSLQLERGKGQIYANAPLSVLTRRLGIDPASFSLELSRTAVQRPVEPQTPPAPGPTTEPAVSVAPEPPEPQIQPVPEPVAAPVEPAVAPAPEPPPAVQPAPTEPEVSTGPETPKETKEPEPEKPAEKPRKAVRKKTEAETKPAETEAELGTKKIIDPDEPVENPQTANEYLQAGLYKLFQEYYAFDDRKLSSFGKSELLNYWNNLNEFINKFNQEPNYDNFDMIYFYAENLARLMHEAVPQEIRTAGRMYYKMEYENKQKAEETGSEPKSEPTETITYQIEDETTIAQKTGYTIVDERTFADNEAWNTWLETSDSNLAKAYYIYHYLEKNKLPYVLIFLDYQKLVLRLTQENKAEYLKSIQNKLGSPLEELSPSLLDTAKIKTHRKGYANFYSDEEIVSPDNEWYSDGHICFKLTEKDKNGPGLIRNPAKKRIHENPSVVVPHYEYSTEAVLVGYISPEFEDGSRNENIRIFSPTEINLYTIKYDKEYPSCIVFRQKGTNELSFFNVNLVNQLLSRYPLSDPSVEYRLSQDGTLLCVYKNKEKAGVIAAFKENPSWAVQDFIRSQNAVIPQVVTKPKRKRKNKTESYSVQEAPQPAGGETTAANSLEQFWSDILEGVNKYKESKGQTSPEIGGTGGKRLIDKRWDFQTAAQLRLNKAKWVELLVKLAKSLGINYITIDSKMMSRGVFRVGMMSGTMTISVNNIYNYATLLHETGHLFDFAVVGKHNFLNTLAERIGLDKSIEATLKKELALVSQFYENALAPGNEGFMRYRAKNEELFAEWFVMYNLHSTIASDLAPTFTAAMEKAFPQIRAIKEMLEIKEGELDPEKATFLKSIGNAIKGTFLRLFYRDKNIQHPGPFDELKDIGSYLYNQMLSIPFWKAFMSDIPAVKNIWKSIVDNAFYAFNGHIAKTFKQLDIKEFENLTRDEKAKLAELLDFGNRPGGKILSADMLAKYKLSPLAIRAYQSLMDLQMRGKKLLIERLKLLADYENMTLEEKARFDERMEKQLKKIEAYVPLVREGKYFVFAARSAEPTAIKSNLISEEAAEKFDDTYFAAHDNYEDALKEAQILKEMGYDLSRVYSPLQFLKESRQYRERLSVYELESLIEAAGVKETAEIRELKDYLRKTAAATRYFMRRRHVAGYKVDFDAFAASIMRFYEIAARRYYSSLAYKEAKGNINTIIRELEPETRTYWEKYIEQVLWASDREWLGIRRAISTITLSFSLTYLMQQSLQNFYTLLPVLANYVSGTKPEKIFASAYKDALSFLANHNHLDRFPKKQLGLILQRAIDEKLISGQYIAQIYGANMNKTNNLMNFLHIFGIQSEFMNRVHIVCAAYKLATEHLGMVQDEQIYEFVKDFVHQTAYVYGKFNAPEIINQTGLIKQIIKLFYLFKSTHLNYLHQMAAIMKKGTTGAKVRMLGVRFLTMGLFRTLPFGALSYAVLRAVFKALAGEDPEKEIMKLKMSKNPLIRNIAIALTYGVLGLSNMDLRDILDIGSIISPNYDPLGQLVGPAYGVSDDIKRGLELVRRGRYTEAAAKLVPFRTIANVITAYEWAREGKQVQNDLILKFSDYEIIQKSLGFTPLRLKEQYRLSELMKELALMYQRTKDRAEERFKSVLINADRDPVAQRLAYRIANGDIYAMHEVLGDIMADIEKNNRYALEMVTIGHMSTGDPMPLKVITTNAQKYSVTYKDIMKWFSEVVKERAIYKALPKGE